MKLWVAGPLFFIAQGAQAQFNFPSVNLQNINSDVMATATRISLHANDEVDGTAPDAPDANGETGATWADDRETSLAFTPNDRRRRANLGSFVQSARASDPQGAAAMEQLFASTDFIGAIDGKMRTIGLRADNVADAYALWWMVAWHATRGTEAEPTRATALAVRDQAARAIGATPEFRGADDAAKQQMAEALLVQAALVDAMNEEYGSDPTMAAKLARAVNEGAGKMGLDLTAMELTPAGFVPRRGADAGGAAGDDAQPTALAAATRPDDSARAGTALPLAIGAVALGGVLLLGRAWGRRG